MSTNTGDINQLFVLCSGNHMIDFNFYEHSPVFVNPEDLGFGHFTW